MSLEKTKGPITIPNGKTILAILLLVTGGAGAILLHQVASAPTVPTSLLLEPENPDPSTDGGLVTMSAVLKRTDNNTLLSNKLIAFQGSDNGGATWWSAGSYLTGANGRATGGARFGYYPGANQMIRAMFAGDATFQPSTSNTEPHTTQPRDPKKWPFDPASIWNLPIGTAAEYLPAGIQQAQDMAMFVDSDVLILTPNAPITPVYYNNDAWSVVPGRCNAEGGVLFSAPIPTDFVVLGSGSGNPHGRTPNYATAILAPDGNTLYQGQPFARCTPGGTATIWWYQTNERLDGMGNSGGHGGSMLSSIGGTLRLGELVPNGEIRHALKLNLDGINYYKGQSRQESFRWPATTADSCAPGCYGGTNQAMRMGSLLALKPDFNINSLESGPGKILARAFQDYGGYAVDNAGWSVYGIATEFSPDGDVIDEFENVWNFALNVPANANTPWSRDLHAIFGALHVTNNWDESQWNTVAASDGTLGAGGGAPRRPWAPQIPSEPPPPPPSPILSADFTWTINGQAVTLRATAWNGTGPYTFAWTFGDGNVGTGQAPTHTYTTPGTKLVVLSVTDSTSQTVVVIKNIQV